jgi:hypothetical protein
MNLMKGRRSRRLYENCRQKTQGIIPWHASRKEHQALHLHPYQVVHSKLHAGNTPVATADEFGLIEGVISAPLR